MPTLWMMIGVPGSGKSTWIANQNFDWNNTIVISTDVIIDQLAESANKTYSEIFNDVIKSATAEMNTNLKNAITDRLNIIWDQTNVTAKARRSKLSQIPRDYKKIAVFFNTPAKDELARRLASRPGKTIPYNIITGMASQLEKPTTDEGFDEIIIIV